MGLAERKISFLHQFFGVQNKEVVHKSEQLLHSLEGNLSGQNPISVEDLLARIAEAEAEAEADATAGRVMDSQSLRNQIKER